MSEVGTALPAVVLGVATALASFDLMRIAWRALQDAGEARRVKDLKFETAMSQTAIFQSLNKSFKTIGSLSLDKYTSDVKARKSVNDFLLSSLGFLGPDPGVLESEPAAQVEPHQLDVDEAEGFQSLEDAWNSLAKARREMELGVRSCAAHAGIPTRPREPISRVLEGLKRAELLDDGALRDLLYFYRIASEAIHGADVPADRAAEALWHARRGMDSLCQQSKQTP